MLEDEQKLVERAKQGDASSFGDLYDHYIKPIYRFVALKVSSSEEAQDLTHDVFLRAWRTLPNFEDQGFPFSSWLYRIARNRVIDHYRTKKHHTDIEDVVNVGLPELTEDTDLGDEFDIKLSVEEVKEVFQELSSDQQDVMIMRFVDELETKEIAQILEKKEGTVRILQYRAIKKIQRKLKTSERDTD